MLGLENVGSYMQAKQAHRHSDWSEVLLDNEGKVVQEEMTKKFQVNSRILPHRVPHLTSIDAALTRDQNNAGSLN